MNENEVIREVCENCAKKKKCFLRFNDRELECKEIQEKIKECDEFIIFKTGKLFK